jgi:sugar/nucleoside kinase (ribokinase family)
VIYGYLRSLGIEALDALLNEADATKAQKHGTMGNLPTRGEIESLLARFGYQGIIFS